MTPGRLIDCLERCHAILNQCNYAVQYEGDCMIDMVIHAQSVYQLIHVQLMLLA